MGWVGRDPASLQLLPSRTPCSSRQTRGSRLRCDPSICRKYLLYTRRRSVYKTYLQADVFLKDRRCRAIRRARCVRSRDVQEAERTLVALGCARFFDLPKCSQGVCLIDLLDLLKRHAPCVLRQDCQCPVRDMLVRYSKRSESGHMIPSNRCNS